VTAAAPTAKASASPAGLGLTGMRERAGLLGGVFTAGPNPDRGWSVTATPPRAVSAG
jgi:signal transduction histidine kinase